MDIESYFSDFEAPGVGKQINGVDLICNGTASLSILFDPNNDTLEAMAVDMQGDTFAKSMTPAEITSEKVAWKVSHAANEEFELDKVSFHFDKVGRAG